MEPKNYFIYNFERYTTFDRQLVDRGPAYHHYVMSVTKLHLLNCSKKYKHSQQPWVLLALLGPFNTNMYFFLYQL